MEYISRMILQRLGLSLISLFAVSIIVFSAITTLPGDFAEAVLGQSATPETVAAFRHQVGLDKPAPTRYFNWILGAIRGDFGQSFSGAPESNRSVASLIIPRLKNTLFLASLVAMVAVPLSLGLGLLAALYRNTLYDRLINIITLVSISVPEFLVAYVLSLLFSVKYHLLPSVAIVSRDMTIVDRIEACALPAMTLIIVTIAHMMRMTRASIINLLASPYIEMAQLKGISPSRIILHHALPNAWAPIITIVSLNLAYLLVGVVVVEFVFVYPGIGRLMVDSVYARDLPVVQACALVFAVTYVSLNLIADTVTIVTNPRLLHRR